MATELQKTIKDHKSVILWVWAAPGAGDPSKRCGAKPPTFWVSGAPGAAQTQNDQFQTLDKFEIPSQRTATHKSEWT